MAPNISSEDVSDCAIIFEYEQECQQLTTAVASISMRRKHESSSAGIMSLSLLVGERMAVWTVAYRL